jgi:hypothetical protein
METKKFIQFLSALILLFIYAGCTSELEILPEDENTFLVDDFYNSEESYKQGLAGVYGNLALTSSQGPGNSNISGLDAGTSQYGRGYWNLQELTTDEAKWSWENDPGLRELNRNTWTSENVILRGFFGRCMTQVAFVNEYLRQSNDAVLNERNVSDTLKEEIQIYRAEVRFLRALAYFHMMDLF